MRVFSADSFILPVGAVGKGRKDSLAYHIVCIVMGLGKCSGVVETRPVAFPMRVLSAESFALPLGVVSITDIDLSRLIIHAFLASLLRSALRKTGFPSSLTHDLLG